jgi:hypothetical protein
MFNGPVLRVSRGFSNKDWLILKVFAPDHETCVSRECSIIRNFVLDSENGGHCTSSFILQRVGDIAAVSGELHLEGTMAAMAERQDVRALLAAVTLPPHGACAELLRSWLWPQLNSLTPRDVLLDGYKMGDLTTLVVYRRDRHLLVIKVDDRDHWIHPSSAAL